MPTYLFKLSGILDTTQKLADFLDALRAENIEVHLAKPVMVSFSGDFGKRSKVDFYFNPTAKHLITYLLTRGNLKEWENYFETKEVLNFILEQKD